MATVGQFLLDASGKRNLGASGKARVSDGTDTCGTYRQYKKCSDDTLANLWEPDGASTYPRYIYHQPTDQCYYIDVTHPTGTPGTVLNVTDAHDKAECTPCKGTSCTNCTTYTPPKVRLSFSGVEMTTCCVTDLAADFGLDRSEKFTGTLGSYLLTQDAANPCCYSYFKVIHRASDTVAADLTPFYLAEGDDTVCTAHLFSDGIVAGLATDSYGLSVTACRTATGWDVSARYSFGSNNLSEERCLFRGTATATAGDCRASKVVNNDAIGCVYGYGPEIIAPNTFGKNGSGGTCTLTPL